MLIGGVVDDQLDQHADAAGVGGVDERGEIVQRAVAGVNVPVVGDVIAIVAQR